MSLVHNENLSSLMNFLCNGSYVTAYAIVVRRRENDCLRLGIFVYAPCDFLCGYLSQNSAALRFFRIGVHRLNGCQPQCVKDGLVAVSCHNQLAARSDTRQNSCDKPSRTSVYQKVRFFNSVKLFVSFHGFSDDSLSLKKIVRSRNFGNIAVHDFVEKISVAVFSVYPRALMPRHVK